MALTAIYQRNAINHGDSGVWLPIFQALFNRGALGANSIDVTNNSGALTVSTGYAGIDDGTTYGQGVIQVTTAGSVSLVGATNNNWHALEYSVSGTAVTFYLTVLAGETDESFMSLTMKGYYDATKGGYYRVATRRTLAYVFIRTATLGRIVNTENGCKGFRGITMIDYVDSTGARTQKYIAKLDQEIGDWNMDSTSNIYVYFNHAITYANIRKIDVMIKYDAGTEYTPLNYFYDTTDPSLLNGGIDYITATYVILRRRTGGQFDSANFDSTSYNRGYVLIEWET